MIAIRSCCQMLAYTLPLTNSSLVQPPYSLPVIRNADLPLPLHCVGIQKPQHRCPVTHDQLAIVVRQSPSGSDEVEPGLRLERVEVISGAVVEVQIAPELLNQEVVVIDH